MKKEEVKEAVFNSENGMTASDIVREIGTTYTTASKWLYRLEAEGVLKSIRVGSAVLYTKQDK